MENMIYGSYHNFTLDSDEDSSESSNESSNDYNSIMKKWAPPPIKLDESEIVTVGPSNNLSQYNGERNTYTANKKIIRPNRIKNIKSRDNTDSDNETKFNNNTATFTNDTANNESMKSRLLYSMVVSGNKQSTIVESGIVTVGLSNNISQYDCEHNTSTANKKSIKPNHIGNIKSRNNDIGDNIDSDNETKFNNDAVTINNDEANSESMKSRLLYSMIVSGNKQSAIVKEKKKIDKQNMLKNDESIMNFFSKYPIIFKSNKNEEMDINGKVCNKSMKQLMVDDSNSNIICDGARNNIKDRSDYEIIEYDDPDKIENISQSKSILGKKCKNGLNNRNRKNKITYDENLNKKSITINICDHKLTKNTDNMNKKVANCSNTKQNNIYCDNSFKIVTIEEKKEDFNTLETHKAITYDHSTNKKDKSRKVYVSKSITTLYKNNVIKELLNKRHFPKTVISSELINISKYKTNKIEIPKRSSDVSTCLGNVDANVTVVVPPENNHIWNVMNSKHIKIKSRTKKQKRRMHVFYKLFIIFIFVFYFIINGYVIRYAIVQIFQLVLQSVHIY